MKSHSFTVTLTFESDISDGDQIREIGQNIAHALKNEADRGMGLVPEDSETFTTEILVENDFEKSKFKLSIV